jgi:hypothetical protein
MSAGTRLGIVLATSTFVFVTVQAIGCADDPPPPEYAGQSCAQPAECYSNLDAGALKGEVQCLTRVQDGYCTHLCQTDADCCAVPGECPGGRTQVCAPFESTGQMMCFLSCESADVSAAGVPEGEYCQRFAHPAFNCRSSGGGKDNRKVCVP